MKVLLVEDDSFFASGVAEFLEDRGIESLIAETVQDALKLDYGEISCVVLDLMLPNDPEVSGLTNEETRAGYYSGIALSRRLRKTHPQIPQILVSGILITGDVRDWAAQQSMPFFTKDETRRELIPALAKLGVIPAPTTPTSFIVHGHDEVALLALKDYIQNTLKWQQPVVLREQKNAGKTIIEKFEDYAGRIDFVFVLLTPDDKVFSTDEEKRHSRQNVIFEMGFFYGQWGRKSGKIILLYKGNVELPSDTQGIVWIDITNGVKAAGESIRKEIT